MQGHTLQRAEIGDFSEKAWLSGQREALAAALDDAPLADSLGILVRTATKGLGPGARAGFYLANAEGTALRHVVGMPDEYAEAVDGFRVGPDSLACGLATHTGQPVLTADVTEDPLWRPWLWMAEKFGYRACWSFPIHTRTRNFVGTLAIYWPEPREATPRDCELATMLTQAAGVIIARHKDAEMRGRTEAALRESQAQLQAELGDTQLLQSISAEIVQEGDTEALYEKILDAAVAIMRSQFGSMQRYHPERGEKGELFLLASRGFSPEATKFWEWVRADSGCTCGHVLRTGKRAIAEDVETCDFMAGTADREALLKAGIHAAQSTPLFSRGGQLLGMISTHWKSPHKPTERDLRLLDIVARQAADLIERKDGEQQLRAREERYRQLVEQTPDGIFVANSEGRYVDVSPAGCEMLGMTREDVLDSVLTDVLAPEEHHRLPSEIARFDDGAIARSQWRMRRKDGSVFDAEIVGRRLPNGNLQGVVRDVTEQRRQAQALREGDEFNRSLMDGSADCVKVLDLEGRLLMMNLPGLGIMEIDDFALLRGKGWATLWPAQSREEVQRAIASARAGQPARFEAACPTAKGTPKVWDVSVTPVRDKVGGQVARLLAVSRDITASKDAETALRESEERFRSMFENAAIGMVLMDRKCVIARANAAFCSITEREGADLVGISCLTFTHPDDLPTNLEAAASLSNGAEVAAFEKRYLLHSGRTSWVRTTLSSTHDGHVLAIVEDINQRKRAEAALRESEERFRAFTQATSDVVYRMSADWTEMRHLRGREFISDTLEPSRSWLEKYIHPDDQKLVMDTIRRAIQSKGTFELEHRVIQLDGTLGWTHSRAIPILDDLGEISEWFGTARDVTRQKHAENVQRQQVERMGLLSDTLAQLLNAGDPDSIVRDLFPKVARHLAVDTFFNYMVNESGNALRLHACAGIPEETARAIERFEFGQAICGTVAQTRSPIHATDIQHSDYDKAALVRSFGIQSYACNPLLVGDRLLGTLSFASHSRTAFDEDELQFLRSVAQYVAVAVDRLQSAKRLRESEERFRMLADNMNQLAWTCDELGDVTWYNQRWLDYTGLSFEEMKDWGWKQVQHPDHVDRVVASVTRSRHSGEQWEDTFPLRGKDGEYRWFLSRAVPIHNAAGEIVRWFGTNTDITEHKRAEETQKLLLNELNHRVKNTLAIVQAIAQRTSARTRDPAEFAKSFGGRIQSLARVHTLLSDANWQGTDLRELIRDQLLSGSVDESRLTAWGPAVRLDPQTALHLALMLHELGTNSSKYGALSGAGWVTVNWTTDDALHLRWIERGGPPVARSSKRGFGTTLIEQSAKGQGGDARMVCEAEGITWDITMPLREELAFSAASQIASSPPPVPEPVAVRHGSPNLSGRRFLVVEDEPLIGLDIVAALEEAQATVEGPVATVEQAFEIIERTSLDGALLDASLYGRPVDSIASALTRRNVPFVFVTGYGPNGLPEAFRQVAILNKPCSREQVINAAADLTTRKPKVVRLRP